MNFINNLLLRLYRKAKKLDKINTYLMYREKYNINNTFKFNGDNILLYGDGEIFIGENSYLGGNSTIQVSRDNFVRIGRNCSISHNVRIYTTSVIPDQDLSLKIKNSKSGNVIINDAVWIGVNVFINPGVTIGENSVVGANSVVTKNIPSNAIFGGVPAKLIRYKE